MLVRAREMSSDAQMLAVAIDDDRDVRRREAARAVRHDGDEIELTKKVRDDFLIGDFEVRGDVQLRDPF
jgi:hypothetical protein